MSNYQESPFTIDEKEYATNEHYFQSQKFEEIEKQELIRNQKAPEDAKKLGGSLQGLR